ncbi:hypothetical protein AUEXF2481DRAFT_568424 [Aureobasidium subglaciale EXF-2481]|uniref:Uncharacterized protein n=1 Tax=Aureobasidium subglaciale (strain EXF-2481) TaxID=1043005 RepID=A0A074XYD9_AURSE|nr:uncharacterized protein AUEXF2481DRAFT_568424 [Aureobasidium subglaciale EXF-2481]KEQ90495.1 hypothetical protein AUEXF2481DRAFT_568424 [Aureobasidium subglaciale EXF-2481]
MDTQLQTGLGRRFHALPSELRAYIFSFLLVRPVKWDLRHLESCEKYCARTTSGYERPTHHTIPGLESRYVCASCGPWTHERNWRHAFGRGFEVYVSPWRSKWAPPQGNSYICSNCYDDRMRTRPFPEPTNLPCLCARRQSLEMRLVCRQWHDEASLVFFSENTFAFDDVVSMGHFFTAISGPWARVISKLSLLFPLWTPEDGPSKVSEIVSFLSILNELPWLKSLELDAKLLNEESAVSALLRCQFTSLRSVSFVVQCPLQEVLWRPMKSPTNIWNELEGRIVLLGGFPEVVARSMKTRKDIATPVMESHEFIQQKRLYEAIQDDRHLWKKEKVVGTSIRRVLLLGAMDLQ